MGLEITAAASSSAFIFCAGPVRPTIKRDDHEQTYLFHPPRRRLVHRSFAGNRPPHLLDRYVGPLWRTCSEQPGRQSRVLGLSGTARRLIGGSSIKAGKPLLRHRRASQAEVRRFVFYLLPPLINPPPASREGEHDVHQSNSRHGARFWACAAFARGCAPIRSVRFLPSPNVNWTFASRKRRLKMRCHSKRHPPLPSFETIEQHFA